uniref:Reverse transcriptase domain-containing protein n=1 Tax=Myripristis murdjan TaxID=586833 RepID=A0A667ZFG8_9TELE
MLPRPGSLSCLHVVKRCKKKNWDIMNLHHLLRTPKFDITILPADKGRTTVILDTTQYEMQMKEMLMDHHTYEILKKDPTEEKKRKLKALLKPLLSENKIDKQTYNHLIPTANITPRIYGTPKIHNPGAPLRPIVDSIGSVTYNLSKTLAKIIKPLLGQTEYHYTPGQKNRKHNRKI